MYRPTLLPTSAQNEQFAGVTYHLDGELVPVLTVELAPQSSIYFEHHILLWKEPQVQIGIKSLQGGFKRMLAGLPIFMTETEGAGQIGFSRDGAGHIFGIHLTALQSQLAVGQETIAPLSQCRDGYPMLARSALQIHSAQQLQDDRHLALC